MFRILIQNITHPAEAQSMHILESILSLLELDPIICSSIHSKQGSSNQGKPLTKEQEKQRNKKLWKMRRAPLLYFSGIGPQALKKQRSNPTVAVPTLKVAARPRPLTQPNPNPTIIGPYPKIGPSPIPPGCLTDPRPNPNDLSGPGQVGSSQV